MIGSRCVPRLGCAIARQAICLIIVTVSSVIASGAARAQTAELDTTLQRQAVKVFLDVPIDEDYVKERIPFVTYVRDRFDADVHIMATTLATPIGGTEYTVQFIGQRSFAGMSDTLRYVSRPTESEEVTRAAVVNVLKMGLMRYVGRTPLASGMVIYYRYRPRPENLIDPWDYWHFSIGTNGNLTGNQNYRYRGLGGSLMARRVTSALKVSIDASTSYTDTRTTYPTRVVRIIRRYNHADASVVKSVSDHWSVGGAGVFLASSYGRERTRWEIAPEIEYDVFPYSEITTKEFRFLYAVKYINAAYHEITIFNKTSEQLFQEGLSINLDVKKNWGTIGGTIEGWHYFHDASKYQLDASIGTSIELIEGFSFDVSGTYSRVHDEIDLPRGQMTDDQILFNLQQMASQYDYSLYFGLSYSFGSKFANIVNKRFGRSY